MGVNVRDHIYIYRVCCIKPACDHVQYIPRNMHMGHVLVVVWYWSISPIFFRVTLLALEQTYEHASKVILKNVHKYNTYIEWASCQIRKMPGAHAPGMPGTFSPLPQVSDPDMHHGTCVTHVPWCMSGSLTSGFLWNRRRGKTFPAFPAHAQPAILRIW